MPKLCTDVAAAGHENALAPQLLQAGAELVVVRRGPAVVDAELEDRHVGVGIDAAEHRPGAVVEPALLIQAHGVGLRCSAVSAASAGAPGAGYRIW
jgi:hypothetical protein